MVSFADLRDAAPTLWKYVAVDWLRLAVEAEQAASNIYDHGASALNEHWTDEVGQRAAQKLKELANSYQVAGATIRGVVFTLEGLYESVESLQRSLKSAVEFAHRYGLVVGPDGRVSQQPGVQCDEDMSKIGQANLLIQEAIESANRIDDEASAELNRLAAAVANTDLDKALNEIQQSASENQLELMREALPIGENPETVAAWWKSLTPQQQAEFERAVPVELYDLRGIPEDVKRRMEGSDGYNRIEMIRWAQQNVNNTDIDIFDNNCANFVSHALHHAGLDEKIAFWIELDDDSWTQSPQTGWDWLDEHDYSHSASWTQSEAQRNFFLKHGGQQVNVLEAQPGDVIYWEQAGPNGPTDPGKVHHAAVVTSVTPDGNIHYTQHTPSRLNASLNGRLPANEVYEGDQRVVIVRPKQTW